MPVVMGLPKSPKENPENYRDPKSLGMEFEEVEITTTDNIKLRGWFVKTQ